MLAEETEFATKKVKGQLKSKQSDILVKARSLTIDYSYSSESRPSVSAGIGECGQGAEVAFDAGCFRTFEVFLQLTWFAYGVDRSCGFLSCCTLLRSFETDFCVCGKIGKIRSNTA